MAVVIRERTEQFWRRANKSSESCVGLRYAKNTPLNSRACFHSCTGRVLFTAPTSAIPTHPWTLRTLKRTETLVTKKLMRTTLVRLYAINLEFMYVSCAPLDSGGTWKKKKQNKSAWTRFKLMCGGVSQSAAGVWAASKAVIVSINPSQSAEPTVVTREATSA